MNDPLEIDCRAVQQLLQERADFLFLDCREPDEHATARIEPAQLVPLGELADRIGALATDKRKPIVVHCHHGGRSLRAAKWLRQQGFARAMSLAGGIDEWSQTIDATIPRY